MIASLRMERVLVVFSTTMLVLSVVAGAPTGQESLSSWREEDKLSSLNIAEDKPSGYLLGFRRGALFKLELNGSISHLWSYDLGSHSFYSENLFAVDTDKELVYLGLTGLFVALDLNTGEVRVQISLSPPNLQYFLNYDYVAKDNAIYGMCTGNNQFNWCRITLHDVHLQKIEVEFLYKLPQTYEIGPAEQLYYMDKHLQLLWYYPGNIYVLGINYTTGEIVFQGKETLVNGQTGLTDNCIAHDYTLNRTFTILWGFFVSYPILAELHPKPQDNETFLMEISRIIRPSDFGTCAYDPKTHTMMVLMVNSSTYLTDRMLYSLVLMDVIGLTYEVVPLPGLIEFTNTEYPLAAIKFVPNAT